MYAQGVLRHGIYPWNEPRRKPRATENPVFYGGDTQSQIDLCLNCKRSKCINCLDHRKSYYVPRTARKERMCKFRERFAELFSKGLTAKELCEEMNISRGAYYRYKNELIDSKGE
mgnify:CR=1 FL=1